MPHIGPLADFGEPEGQDPEDRAPPEAALFVRPIPTRAAMPWDQARAAALEARLNAPLPIGELAWQIRRLQPWRPGAPGRYVAIYARREDVRDGLTAAADVDGRAVPVQFPSPGKRREQVRRLAVVGTGAGLAAFLLVSSVISVLAVRVRAAAQLDALEQATAGRLEQTRAQKALQAQEQAITAAGLTGRRASRVLNDLAWAARSKAPDAGVEGFLWEGTLFAVEVRGEANPFPAADRRVERSASPVRPGVWLWGVTDDDAGAKEAP
ncbi:MAG: hypothetical protein Q7T19_14665 [Caulobacter sp.]|nr:hypothetical protein [Caulobacter sp.]